MTRTEFMALCDEHLVYPVIALENEEICEALQKRNDQQVKRLLAQEHKRERTSRLFE